MAKKKEEKKETKPVETADEVIEEVVNDETVTVDENQGELTETEEVETADEVEKPELYTLSKPDTMFYDGRFVITSEDKIPLPDVITGPIQARLDSGFIVKVEE
ncbi:hypothetical protein JZO82_14825 [Vagococcus fluvialis]|uniref:hypothetical protein n=1 Tax=Vagococcus fluvialis TaxID=2738 RepID=UPI001A8C45CC|nr:hypothetical protein [Vagococcus fluvialis]MBO0430439.1 hypothetical protein [Vagococcus fluvialis]